MQRRTIRFARHKGTNPLCNDRLMPQTFGSSSTELEPQYTSCGVIEHNAQGNARAPVSDGRCGWCSQALFFVRVFAPVPPRFTPIRFVGHFYIGVCIALANPYHPFPSSLLVSFLPFYTGVLAIDVGVKYVPANVLSFHLADCILLC
jgi:hypothetical protein